MTVNLLETVAELLRRHRLPITRERDLQDAVAALLTAAGIEFIREFPLTRGPVDFYLSEGRVALELKVKGSPASVAKQVVDYLADDCVAGLLLVTGKRSLGRLPAEVLGKPVVVVTLWKGLL